MTETVHQLINWVSLHPYWAGIAVFLVAMGESLAIVGLLIPGVVLMFSFGALISLDAMGFWPTFGWAVAGAVAGDGLSFFLGRHFRDRITGIWPFSRHPRTLQLGVDFFQRHGGKSVAIGRFFGPVRAIIPLVAGMLGMPPAYFITANIASALIWAPAYLLPGMVLGASLELASEVAFGLVALLLLLVALAWMVMEFTRQLFRLLQPHASAWIQALLNWAQLHPRLSEIAAALADPRHPEAGGLAILASILILATGLFSLIFGLVLGGTGLSGLDQMVYQGLQSLRTPWADHLMVHFSRLADTGVIIPLVAGVTLFLASQRHWRTAGYCLAALAFALLAPMILKYSLQIPRPSTGITGLGSYSFPSGHTLRATVLFGFLSVMIARPLPPPRRWLPYMLAGLLVMPVALSRLYLGAHWLSDVFGAISLGLTWVALLGIAYHHHATVETHWRGLTLGSLILLTSATGLQAWHRHGEDLARYIPTRPTSAIATQAWWDREWAGLPQSREDLRGHQAHPLHLQYGGTLERLKQHLVDRDWQPAQILDWGNALMLLSPSLPLEALPVLPQVHDGRHEALALFKPQPDGSRLVLRLWATDRILTPEGARLWLGNVSIQRQALMLNLITFPETQPNFHPPLEALGQDIDPLPHRTTEETGTLLLLQPAA
jgi:undecaprenyl-diphosphatase